MNQQQFEQLSEIIKKGDTDLAYQVDFILDVFNEKYIQATIKLDIDGEDDYSLVYEDDMISFRLNENILFTIDELYTYNWIDFVNKKFTEHFPVVDNDDKADLADLRIKEAKEDRFFKK